VETLCNAGHPRRSDRLRGMPHSVWPISPPGALCYTGFVTNTRAGLTPDSSGTETCRRGQELGSQSKTPRAVGSAIVREHSASVTSGVLGDKCDKFPN